MVVVGTLMAATLAIPGTASASSRHHAYFHTAHAGFHTSRPRFAAYRPRIGSYGRVRHAWRRPLGRHGYAWARPDFRRHLAVAASAPAVAGGGGQVGRASFYGLQSRTANGGRVGAATCAHRSLPFGTRVLVTNLANQRQAVLTVNDRGPFVAGRIVDVSVGAAGTLGMLHSGTANVRVQVVGGPG
jgi:rare lipoprotein A